MPLSYLTDGDEIYKRSFAMVRAESDLATFTSAQEHVAVRMIHASGDISLSASIKISQDAVERGTQALQRGAKILCDSNMVAHGITKARMPAGNEALCYLRDPRVPALAAKIKNTRSAAAVELWRDDIEGAVVAIGNAPTALFRLLELLEGGWPKPSLVIGIPVGFVGAAESKIELMQSGLVPYITVCGRRGGSAIAAAAVNAIASRRE